MTSPIVFPFSYGVSDPLDLEGRLPALATHQQEGGSWCLKLVHQEFSVSPAPGTVSVDLCPRARGPVARRPPWPEAP